MATRLEIRDTSYLLVREEGSIVREMAFLAGGAASLLPPAPSRGVVRDLDIEAAIERSEEWLMPHASEMAGGVLQVRDGAGRLCAGLGREGAWTVEEVEDAFNRMLALLPTQREAAFVADLVLVRELTHHGRVASVEIRRATR